MKNKAIKLIKEIRKIEDKHFEKAVFCREHNMELENIKHVAIEKEVRKIIRLIENEFDTGYIPNED
jgi:hypothetical protein